MRKLFVRCTVLILILVLSQVLLSRYLVPNVPMLTLGIPGIGKLDTYLNLHETYSTLYFGDSIIKAYAPSDHDTRSIAEMVTAQDPTIKIGDMSSPGYGLNVFEAMVTYISHASKKPDAIIIPINMRSFSPQWDMRPEYQFEKEIFFLTHNKFVFYFGKPLSIFQAVNFESVTSEMFRDTPVFSGKTQIGTVGIFEDKARQDTITEDIVKDFYQYDYMGQLDSNHRKLLSLQNIANMANEHGIHLYVYITPIDYEQGVQYVGPMFKQQVKKNTDVVCAVLKEEGVPCLNLVFSVGSKNFEHGLLPNEHMKESGRNIVADELVRFITSQRKQSTQGSAQAYGVAKAR